MLTVNLKKDLEALYRSASGNATGRGAVRWASETLEVSRRTVERWLAGETRPAAGQIERLRVVAGVAERARKIRSDRLARRGPWRRLSQWLGSGFKDEVTEAADRRAEERAAAQTRANQAFQPRPQRSWLHGRLTDTAERIDVAKAGHRTRFFAD